MHKNKPSVQYFFCQVEQMFMFILLLKVTAKSYIKLNNLWAYFGHMQPLFR